METITRQALFEKLNRGDHFVLIEVSPKEAYEKDHIPGAINIQLDSAFERCVRRKLPDKDKEIVVYSWDETCDAAPKAVRKLKQLGYHHVRDYLQGKLDWTRSGLRTMEGA